MTLTRMLRLSVLVVAVLAATLVAPVANAATGDRGWGGGGHGGGSGPWQPDLGPNVTIFDPSMSAAEIEAAATAVFNKQKSNEFGADRFALLFKPGTYGSATEPLNFEVGYYTSVAGLAGCPGT